ncbi:GSCOCG00008674001-RA-CDS, partial [Cotesia congregata]
FHYVLSEIPRFLSVPLYLQKGQSISRSPTGRSCYKSYHKQRRK